MGITCPKPVYALARLARRFCPEFLIRPLLSSQATPPEQIATIFSAYLDATKRIRFDVRHTRILELGSGVYNPAAIGFVGLGAEKVFLLEPFYSSPNLRKYELHMSRLFATVGNAGGRLEPADVYSIRNGRVVYDTGRVELINTAAPTWPLPDHALDLVLSNAVIEHLHDLPAAAEQMARCLRPGGVAVHVIDFRDHFFKYPFDMLKWSKFAWERILTTRRSGGGYLNRLRLGQVLAIFRLNGLEPTDVQRSTRLADLRSLKNSLHKDFAHMDEEDLATVTATVTLTRT